MTEHCVVCGTEIPEGRQVCPACEKVGIGKWVKEQGPYVTPGGTPYYVCAKCGGSGHLFGVEYSRRKYRCDNCGTQNFYPWEWYKIEVNDNAKGSV